MTFNHEARSIFICNAVDLSKNILDTKLGAIQQDAKYIILVSVELRGLQSIMKLHNFKVKGSCNWKNQKMKEYVKH